MIKLLLITFLLTFSHAIDCSAVEELEMPSVHTFNTSKQISFHSGEASKFKLQVCVLESTGNVHVGVYDKCYDNEFKEELVVFETHQTCEDPFYIDITPEVNQLFYMNISISENITYQVGISTEETDEPIDINQYVPYILLGICLVCVGLMAIILAIVSSHRNKKLQEEQIENLLE